VWIGRKRLDVRVLAVWGLAVMLLATQWSGWTAWRLVYDHVPGGQAIRAIARIAILLLFPVGLGVALAVERAWQRGRAWRAAAVIVAALCVLEQGQTTPTFDKQKNRDDVAAVAARIDPGCEAFLYSPVNGRFPYWKYQLDAMWASLATGIPTVNGYSGNWPKDYPFFQVNLRSKSDEATMTAGMKAWLAAEGASSRRVCWIKLPEAR
jgi:hypothetical protein